MTRVCVVGSVNIDLTCHLPRWPERGETIAVLDNRKGLGGKGANQAVAAARMGANVHLIGAIGGDEFGQYCRREISQAGVKTHLTEFDDHATGMALIDVGPDGNNIIRLSHGANFAWTPHALSLHSETIAMCDVLLLQNEIPLEISMLAASIARRSGALVVMDPAPAPSTPWSSDTLSRFDILTPNAHEAGLMLGAVPRTLAQARAAAVELTKRSSKSAIVTMGGDGVAWCINEIQGQLVPPQVRSIDTVGAGDCFNGAFAASLVDGAHNAAAIEMAATAASLATTQAGAAGSMPTNQQVEDFLSRSAVA